MYEHLAEVPWSKLGASLIVPVISRYIHAFQTIVDIGGGTGCWVKEFKDVGTEHATLIDCEGVRPYLLPEVDAFVPCDLSIDNPPPMQADLAICLEFVEHIPAHRSEPIIDWICNSAKVVLFSAAIPGQAGTGHINLHRPRFWDYLFSARGFERYDIVRGKIIHDKRIPWWYRQNMVVYTPDPTTIEVSQDYLPADFHIVHRDVS